MGSGRLNSFWKVMVVVSSIIGIVLSINQLFYLQLLGYTPVEMSYLYFLLACFMPLAFLIFPAKRNQNMPLKWYDIVLFVVSLITIVYFGFQGERIIIEGWSWSAPELPTYLSIVLWGLLLEALRRTGGLILSSICLIVSLYPLMASDVPLSFLQGQKYDFLTAARTHIMGSESVLGIPFTTVGNLIIGFLVFGVILTHTGGGDFFFKLAQSMFGNTRGGEAKVSVIGSAFFGMLSGSAVSNTVTTGAMTIPAMKKTGFKPHYAAGIEASASTGGTITPPIMGSAAFIMASFLAIPYYEIALAAAIPAVLYFLSIFVQIDGYAAKHNLKRIPTAQIPSFWGTLKNGWLYIIALVLLIYFIVVLNSEGQAPYYASVALLLIAMIKKETRLNVKSLFEMFTNIGKVLTEIVCIIAGIGLIVGALSATGAAFSFSRELVSLAGDSMIIILISGAITSFILGMGMTVSAVYVFLAIVLAPALVEVGIDPIAAHLFVVYFATLSYITPPVALAAFAASGIAGSHPMKTGFTAMRLGATTFLIPFFFVYEPALIGNGTIIEIIISTGTAFFGVFIMASALEGYLIGFGRIMEIITRFVILGAGLCMLIPGFLSDTIGIFLILLVYTFKLFKSSSVKNKEKVNI